MFLGRSSEAEEENAGELSRRRCSHLTLMLWPVRLYTPPFSRDTFFVTFCHETPDSLSPKGS